jgi:hypothetical protein
MKALPLFTPHKAKSSKRLQMVVETINELIINAN